MTRVRITSLLFLLCSLVLGFNQAAIAAKANAEPVVANAEAQTGKLNINTADESALQAQMIGIGPSKAKAIVQYREENGPFSSVDDLLEVKGIGAKTLDRNRDKLSVE